MKKFKLYLQKRGYAKASTDTITGMAAVFCRWLKQEGINERTVTYNDVLKYLKHCRDKGNKPATLNLVARMLYLYFDFLQYEKNPAVNIRIKGRIREPSFRLLDENKLTHIYTTWPESSPTLIRDKCIIGLLVFQAVRTGELAALLTTDISADLGVVQIPSVQRSVSRKLMLQPGQLPVLKQYINEIRPVFLQAKPENTDRLFITAGASLKSGTVYNIFHAITTRLKKLHPDYTDLKQVRASVITHWTKQHNLRQVQQMAGHRYLSSTERYCQNNLEELTLAIEQFHPNVRK